MVLISEELRYRRSLPIAAWPAPDRRAWLEAMRQGTVLEEGGLGSDWAEPTRVMTATSYGRWLRWLADQDLDPALALADRATPTAVSDYISHLKATCATRTVITHLSGLLRALKAMVPSGGWAWFTPIIRRLEREAVTTREKRSRLVKPSDLIDLGMALMSRSMAEAGRNLDRAIEFRNGLMVALLAAQPLRRRNFIAIEIGRHLIERIDGFWICFDASDTKNRMPIELPLPDWLQPQLDHYLRTARVRLCRQGAEVEAQSRRSTSDLLWVSRGGAPLGHEGFRLIISKSTERWFGFKINPHLFRDIAATAIAVDDPDHVQIIPSLLGQRSGRTCERYYIHAANTQATDRLQEQVLLARRQASGTPVAVRSGLKFNPDFPDFPDFADNRQL